MQDSDGHGLHAPTVAGAHLDERRRRPTDRSRVRAYIGLGANVGDAQQSLERAVASLAGLPGAKLVGVSRLYRTKPVGVVDQPDFVNAVAALDLPAAGDPTAGALDLLVALKRLERQAGRRRRRRWGPRELDLDLLVYGGHRVRARRPSAARPASAATDPDAAARLLDVPHPALRDRLFVLAPLADLAPDLVPPGWAAPVEPTRALRAELEGRDAVVPIGHWDGARGVWRS